MATTTTASTPGSKLDHTALVVGTGFGGLYALHLLRHDLGLDAVAVDAAGDVGGTWHWNRYPGARSDVESHVYRYSWDRDLLQDGDWKNNYIAQPEIEEYFRDVTKRYGLYPFIRFRTELVGLEWEDEDEDEGEGAGADAKGAGSKGGGAWRVHLKTTTADGTETTKPTTTTTTERVRYVVAALGILSKPNIPRVPGLDEFARAPGRTLVHSARWRPEIEWKGKRVAVVGTGATGVQLVNALGDERPGQGAASVTQFVRHAQYVIPTAFRPVAPEERAAVKAQYDDIWRLVYTTVSGMGFVEPARPALSVSAADREAIFEDLWKAGSGFRFFFGGFSDLAFDETANREAMNFLHRKIRQIVRDQETAAVLTPSTFFARRPLTDDKYYDRFNQPNVSVVNAAATPIVAATPTGLVTSDGKHREFDLIVLATGFDAIDGPFNALDVRGRSGARLNDHWSAGPRTLLGAETAGFPNFFFVNGPGAPFANNAPIAEEGARFAAALIAEAERRHAQAPATIPAAIEPASKAEDEYTDMLGTLAQGTLFARTPSWFFGENVEGKKVAPRVYFGGLSRFRALLAENREKGFPGFVFGGDGGDA